MITLSDDAKKELDAFFEAHTDQVKCIRLFVAPGGCCGPALSMALDQKDTQDVWEEIGGITFCMDEMLFAQVGNVGIELTPMGFVLNPENPLPSSGGSCSCSGGCNCGSGSCGGH